MTDAESGSFSSSGPARPAWRRRLPPSGAGCATWSLEKGALVNSLVHYPTDMVFFTTPELLEIGGLPFVSPYEKPTRQEALRYYRRVADTFELDVALRRDGRPRVDASGRRLFAVTSEPAARRAGHADGPRRGDGDRRVRRAEPARRAGRRSAARLALLSRAAPVLPPPRRHRRRQELGGRSGARSLPDRRARSRIVHRGAALGDSIKYWVKPDIENRIKEGSIRAHFGTRVAEITPTDVALEGPGAASTRAGRRRAAPDRLSIGHDAAAHDRRRDRRSKARRSTIPRRSRRRCRTSYRRRRRSSPAGRAAASSSRTAASTARSS